MINDNQQENDNILDNSIENELTKSYLDYSMSIITSRAIPDVRDGLKTVQRRVLYGMFASGNTFKNPFRKSSKPIGEILAKYHPHGDKLIYDVMVRMVQDFVMNKPYLIGQGNFGSIDGDPAASMRYTGIKLSNYGESMLEDLDKNTVDFELNYDDTALMPEVLPASCPNLLINGTQGIAVGFATSIPPHNLSEVIAGTIFLIKNNQCSLDELLNYIPGPDFPLGGEICNGQDLKNLYATGKGSVVVRARVTIDHKNHELIINDLPYQVNKAELISYIGQEVNKGNIKGITNIVDDSEGDGSMGSTIKIIISIARDYNPDIVLNQLYRDTQLQYSFHCNFLALNHKNPSIYPLKDMLQAFINHRLDVVTRRTRYLIDQKNKSLVKIQGLYMATLYIDSIVSKLKTVNDQQEAIAYLTNTKFTIVDKNSFIDASDPTSGIVQDDCFYFSDIQAKYVLDMKLMSLTKLEIGGLLEKATKISEDISQLMMVLKDRNLRLEVVIKELETVAEKFGTKRISNISINTDQINDIDLITPKDVIITLTSDGYIKRQEVDNYQIQHRGGIGKVATSFKKESMLIGLTIACQREDIYLFSNWGRVFKIKIYKLPEGDRYAKGKPIGNFIKLASGENIINMLSIGTNDKYLVMVTKKGYIKKSLLSLYKTSLNGLIAIKIKENDSLVQVFTATDDHQAMILSQNGKAAKFDLTEVRALGRNSIGVIGMISDSPIVGAFKITNDDHKLLVITALGYGKLTKISSYRKCHRGTQGTKTINLQENDKLVGGLIITPQHHIYTIATEKGVISRVNIKEIPTYNRSTKGVRIIKLRQDYISNHYVE